MTDLGLDLMMNVPHKQFRNPEYLEKESSPVQTNDRLQNLSTTYVQLL